MLLHFFYCIHLFIVYVCYYLLLHVLEYILVSSAAATSQGLTQIGGGENGKSMPPPPPGVALIPCQVHFVRPRPRLGAVRAAGGLGVRPPPPPPRGPPGRRGEAGGALPRAARNGSSVLAVPFVPRPSGRPPPRPATVTPLSFLTFINPT